MVGRRRTWKASPELGALLIGFVGFALLMLLPDGGRSGFLALISQIGQAVGGDAQARDSLAGYLAAALASWGVTMLLTIGATGLCCFTAFGLVVAEEVNRLTPAVKTVLVAISAVPSFLWWAMLVLVSTMARHGLLFIRPIGKPFSAGEEVIFWGVAMLLISYPSGSLIAAAGSMGLEMRRLRREPFTISARAREAAGWEFYWRHLRRSMVGIGLERVGGILGNCFVVEWIMNIKGLGLMGIDAYSGDRGARYFVIWLSIGLLCLISVRILNLIGQWLVRCADPRARKAVLVGAP